MKIILQFLLYPKKLRKTMANIIKIRNTNGKFRIYYLKTKI